MSHRCESYVKLSRICPKAFLEAPQQTKTIEKDLPFKDHPTNVEFGGEAVQLKPQEVSLELRVGEEEEILLDFKAAKNYPLDLYYLMDLSASMKDDKDTVAKMGKKIADIFKKGELTGNFRLGFGGFSDKTVSPFIVDTAEMRNNPCAGISEQCDPPFNFKNKMSLTEDVDSFESVVRDTRVTGNTDKPESGLEAVLQAIKCKNQIGWRSVSRKLIVYSSDANFHFAGDGRLGGIVEPNLGECRMVGDELPGDDPYDYPSIGQVRAAALQNHVNLIFATAASELAVYRELSQLIEGSAVGVLSSNSSNIIALIQDNYNKISSEVILAAQTPTGISLSIDAKCPGNQYFEKGRANCTGVGFGETVSFRVRLKAESDLCKIAPKGVITVSPIGFADGLKIKYSTICSCDCETSDLNTAKVDAECSNHGTKQCGVCYCTDGYSGKSCNCTGASASLFLEKCRNPDVELSDVVEPVCTGRGDCVCGQCHCHSSRFTGEFCECDNEDCDRKEGQLCSGNGICQCGRCICNPGYGRHDCSCLEDPGRCYNNGIGPSEEEPVPCSGHGTCTCGKCLCEAGYLGDTCNDCPKCASHCLPNRDCALCRAGFSWGPMGNITKEECDRQCAHIQVAGEEGATDPLPSTARECNYPAADQPECVVQFWYWYEKTPNPITKQCILSSISKLLVPRTSASRGYC